MRVEYSFASLHHLFIYYFVLDIYLTNVCCFISYQLIILIIAVMTFIQFLMVVIIINKYKPNRCLTYLYIASTNIFISTDVDIYIFL